MHRIFFSLFSFSILVLGGGCSKERPVGEIVFTSSRDGNLEIYSMAGDGTNPRRLTNNPANDDSPAWSPDGNSILFASDRDGFWNIYEMSAVGADIRQLTTGRETNIEPCWGKDGGTIGFISSRDTIGGELYLMNRDGSNVRRITHGGLVKEASVLSPDGMHACITLNDRDVRSLAMVNLSTGHIEPFPTPGKYSQRAKFSADGSALVLSSYVNGSFKLFTISNTGDHSLQVTRDGTHDVYPTWGWKTDEVIYVKRGGIYRLQLETGKESMLSNGGDAKPDWTSH